MEKNDYADCPACEGTGQQEEICSGCCGSGEGAYENTKCRSCGGGGNVHVECIVCNGESRFNLEEAMEELERWWTVAIKAQQKLYRIKYGQMSRMIDAKEGRR